MSTFHSCYSLHCGGTTVQQEYLNLPLIDPDSPFLPFPNEFFEEIKLMMVRFLEIWSVVQLLANYKMLGPLLVSMWGSMEMDTGGWGVSCEYLPLAHLPEHPVNPEPGFVMWLKLPLSPLMWDMINKDHSHYNLGPQAQETLQ
ncbi:hypothetical protein FRC08_013668 [Ceratobasidium sp. 394]|nr:hypothetical protein FRC08_013668 [Ceratobasidium sp. 394]